MSAWTPAAIVAVVVAYAALSGWLDRTPVTAAIFFVAGGLALGTEGLGWIDVAAGGESVRLLAEITLTLVLFADASQIDVTALRREYAVPVRLLAIGLPLTIVAGLLVALGVFPALSVGEAALLAIILAPTDAALGQAVVSDRRLPSRIRQGLNVESGLNDGICVPLLFIALAVSEAEADARSARGAFTLVAEAIGYGTLFGLLCGAGGALVLRTCRAHGLIATSWVPVVPLGTAALSYVLATQTGGSGFIAAFVAGFVFGVVTRGEQATGLLEELGELANAATFIVFGAVIAGPALRVLTWQAVGYAILSLTLIRMLPVAVAFLGSHARPPTLAFAGWFGPRGLASIVFVVIVADEAELPHMDTIGLVVVATILLSVVAHGISAKPLTARYAAWYRAHPRPEELRLESGTAGSGRAERPAR